MSALCKRACVHAQGCGLLSMVMLSVCVGNSTDSQAELTHTQIHNAIP